MYIDPIIAWPLIIFFFVFLLKLANFIHSVYKSPFHYPYFNHCIDVSGRKNPSVEDLIDEFLINNGFSFIQNHKSNIDRWKRDCLDKVDGSMMKEYRFKQYQQCLDDDNAFNFIITRKTNRYMQRTFSCDYEYLLNRDRILRSINYECTINSYFCNNQRKLMTPELRKKIKERDHYTCQMCGKYMPDEVGLHIDHIIPISKGGKTIPSNLQVLCSKCNGRKSNKM
ncbi:HNH endonuclease [Faecalitalea cylindroides]|uniref:HNH endonuclease n=1 Tax=Faecalitalea cylindroides TaxID=39483 RepID=A0A1Y4LTZ0_9FIRM|nr:HNH endonuclease [Faecalitalea cylindroides]OUP60098.1 HNH endonuclease [Faecalitalea cylindroides]